MTKILLSLTLTTAFIGGCTPSQPPNREVWLDPGQEAQNKVYANEPPINQRHDLDDWRASVYSDAQWDDLVEDYNTLNNE